jgi:ABC-type lipoprotein release transport system permease subunit
MSGPKLATMAWRNLWRNRRRTLITLFGIAFGVMLAVISTGIGDSSYSKMIDYAARMGAGHVTVQHPEYVELPSLKKTVTGTAAIIDEAKRQPEVTTAVPRISGAVMLATARGSYGSGFIALDPAQESAETLEILGNITQGSFFATSHDKGVILGAKLAENLDAQMGKRVVYTMTDKNGEIVSGLARVSGIVNSGAPSLDNGLCLLPLDVVRETLVYEPDEATQVAIFLRDNRDAGDVARRIDGALTWQETQPELSGFISMKVNGTIVMEVIIMLLIGAGIFNSLFVSVMERLRSASRRPRCSYS